MSAIPPLVIQALVPLSTHSSVASSYLAPGAVATDIGPGVGFGGGEGSELDVVGVAVALRHPLHDLFAGARCRDTGGGQTRAHDGHADAGVAPEQLLDGHRQGEPGGVVHHGLGHELPAVEPDLGRFLDHGVREFLALVPLVSHRSDLVHGELMDPLLDLELIFVQLG